MAGSGMTTEHARAWRAELLGAIAFALGLYWRDWHFAAVGAALVAVVAAAYFFSRGAVKASGARPASVLAHPRV